MVIKKTWQELLEWATENDEHRKQMINEAGSFIIMLSNSERDLSKEDIEKIFGAAQVDLSHMINIPVNKLKF